MGFELGLGFEELRALAVGEGGVGQRGAAWLGLGLGLGLGGGVGLGLGLGLGLTCGRSSP